MVRLTVWMTCYNRRVRQVKTETIQTRSKMTGDETTAQLQAYLLGGTLFTLDGEPIHLPTRTAQAVLVYLLHQPRPIPRERLSDLFFPTSSPKQAAANLRATLSRLRKVLAPFLNITRAAIGINEEAAVWVDALVFEKEGRGETGEEKGGALALYQGDFLAGFALRDAPEFEQWMVVQQERLRMLAIERLRVQVDRQTARAEFAAALQSCDRLLAIEPLLESMQYAKLMLLARTGQRVLALRHFEAVQALFEDELGVALSAETHALHSRIQTLPAQTPAKLPPQRAAFVGRTRELAQLTQLLAAPNARLLTLLGAGGMGKTRLAIQAAQTLLDQRIGLFLDGLYFVPLADITDEGSAGAIATAIAAALGLKLRGSQPPAQQLLTHLQSHELLLILDNIEHLLNDDTVPAFLSTLLTETSTVKLLVTSRTRLDLYEETVFDVDGLSLPSDDGEANQSESVQLFMAHARRQQHEFVADSAEITHITTACRLVEGIPLAIELAAGATRQQTTAEIASSIQASYDSLATRFRNVPSRHRSLRAAFDYSWRLLTVTQQQLLAALSIFPASFAPESAYAIADADRQTVQALVDQSLVKRESDDRLVLHASVREFSAENLPDVAPLRLAHATHYTEQIVQFSSGNLDKTAFDQLDRERVNLFAAWQWQLDQHQLEQLRQFMKPLFEYFNWSGRWQEGIGLFRQARRQLGPDDARTAALLEARIGRLLIYTDQLDEAAHLIEPALDVLESYAEQVEASLCYALRGRIAMLQGDYAGAIGWGERGLRLAHSAEESEAIASNCTILGSAHKSLGNYAAAREHMETSLAINNDNGDQLGAGIQLNNLGNLMNDQAQYADALAYWDRATAIFSALEFAHGQATTLSNAAISLGKLQRFAEAETLQRRAIAIKRELGNKRSLALSLAILSDALLSQGSTDAAKDVLDEGLTAALEADAIDALLELFMSSADYLAATEQTETAAQIARFLVENDALREATKARASQLMQDLAIPVNRSLAEGEIVSFLRTTFAAS